jgi:hypothetical protein
MLVSEATTIFEPAADEINTLHVHPNAKKKPWLAIPDDEGDIGILDMKTRAMRTTLRGQHSNICTSVAFRPRCAGYDLVRIYSYIIHTSIYIRYLVIFAGRHFRAHISKVKVYDKTKEGTHARFFPTVVLSHCESQKRILFPRLLV